MRIAFIGAGNLATHLAPALQGAGHEVLQVFSRTEDSARTLGDRLSCAWTTSIDDVTTSAQLYVFSVRDAVLQSLADGLYRHLRAAAQPGHPDCGASALFLHTAGSMSMDVLPTLRRGVLYPMQTFSKSRPVDFRQIPVFVESRTDERLVVQLAHDISDHVYQMSGEDRRYLHVAAVFACNFTNHMYDLCARMLQQHDIPFSVMLPLIDETARKVHELAPSEAQTGPAIRYDQNVIQRHLDMIDDEETRRIYKLLTDSIHDKLRSDQD